MNIKEIVNNSTITSFPYVQYMPIGDHCSPLLPALSLDIKHASFKYIAKHSDIGIFSFPGASDVWFSLRNTTYQNNSIVTLEEIGEDDVNSLLCITACCRSSDTDHALGNWYFSNGTRVPSEDDEWDFFRARDQMVVSMHRRRGGVEGIYRCVIPDAMNVTQTIYIGVYSASTGEWVMYTLVLQSLCCRRVNLIGNICSKVN